MISLPQLLNLLTHPGVRMIQEVPPELLAFIKKPITSYTLDGKPVLDSWQVAFDVLLSKENNYGKVQKVRQQAMKESLLPTSRPTSVDLVFVRPIEAEELRTYTFVLIRHQIQIYPGRSAASYYWFSDDGVLQGAGLMSTGHRCSFIDATIERDADHKRPESRRPR